MGHLRHAVGLSVVLVAAHPARAQNDATAPAPPTLKPAPNGQLEEIVVTAQKRRETARKIAGSIGVISGTEITDHHIENFEDITRTVPGVSFAAHNGPGQDNISIRGVASTVGNPTVGVYLDEVPIITQSGYVGQSQPRLFDLDRIEVLRGPQGTLYGASSEGGTIRFITTQPNMDTYSAYVRSDVSGTVHGGPNTDQQMAVNIPIVPGKLAVRISGEFIDDSGYIDQYALDGRALKQGTNFERGGVFHVTAKYQATDDFTITPSFFFQTLHDGDAPTFIESLGVYKQDKLVREWIDDTLYIPSLTLKKGLGFADVTSITSYFTRDVDRQADGTFFNSAAIAQFFLDPAYPQHQAQNDGILGVVPSPVLFEDRFHTLTQELRIASNPGRLRWVAGLFYSDQVWTHNDYEVATGFSADFKKIYGYDIDSDPVLNPTAIPNLFNNDLVWHVYDHNDITQYAAFGQIDFDILPTLHFSAGERYVYAKETFSEVGAGFFDIGGAGTTGTPYTQSATFTAPTPKFSLVYDLSANASLYATIAKGFRLGGATTPNTNVSCVAGLLQLGYTNAPNTYGSDQLWSYEAGAKALLMNNRLSVNAAGYYIDWSRIQQTITIPICGGAFNSNVGDAVAYGGEFEARFRPAAAPGLVIGLNAGAEHASITSTKNASTAAVGENVLFTPSWTASLVTNYSTDITDNVSGFIKADYDWTGPSNGSFQVTDPNYRDPAYATLNANVGVEFGSWQAALYAKNLTDSKIILQRPVINSVVEAYTLRPLTIGLTLTKHF